MKKNSNKMLLWFVGIIALVGIGALFYFGGFLNSFISPPGVSINYTSSSGYSFVGYDCNTDNLESVHHVGATGTDLLEACRVCVLSQSSVPVNGLGDCQLSSNSIPRYRFNSIALSSSSFHNTIVYRVTSEGRELKNDDPVGYHNAIVNNWVTWSNQYKYCPVNMDSYLRINSLGYCSVPVSDVITGNVVVEPSSGYGSFWTNIWTWIKNLFGF